MDAQVAAAIAERDALQRELDAAIERRRVAEERLHDGADPRLASMLADVNRAMFEDQVHHEREVAAILERAE